MRDTLDVAIPLDTEAASALASPARREAAGRYLSSSLKAGRLPEILAEATAEAKREARARGLADRG